MTKRFGESPNIWKHIRIVVWGFYPPFSTFITATYPRFR